jgi:hypothetical protein
MPFGGIGPGAERRAKNARPTPAKFERFVAWSINAYGSPNAVATAKLIADAFA